MSAGRLLVVTTVHTPDDARIRAKLIGTLSAEWEVTYAARHPGPTDPHGLTWHPLAGGRVRRWWAAALLMQAKDWDLVAVHDPELLPAALMRAWRRRCTLFDVHENVPAQILTKTWIPSVLRRPLSWVASLLLRAAERVMTVTLAEVSYHSLFRNQHPVLANYLPSSLPPPVSPAEPPFLAYLGDVTEQRGAFLAIEAAAGAGMGLVMVGRVAPPEFVHRLAAEALARGVILELDGARPHPSALARIAPARAGLSPLADIPNYRDSLPTKVLEYLALGLPVLAADLPGTRAVTGDRVGMTFVAPGDRDAWRRAGEKLAATTSLRAEVMARAEETRRDFSWPAAEVLRIYRQAARR